MRVSLVCKYYENGASNIAVVVSFFDRCCGPWCTKMRNFKCRFYMMSVLALELISYKRNAMCLAALCCNGFGVPARHLSVLCWQSVSENFSSSSNVSVLLPFLHFSDYSQKRRLKAVPLFPSLWALSFCRCTFLQLMNSEHRSFDELRCGINGPFYLPPPFGTPRFITFDAANFSLLIGGADYWRTAICQPRFLALICVDYILNS